MEKKANYEHVEFEIIYLTSPDIITTSVLGDEEDVSDDYGWTTPGKTWS